MPDTSSVRSLKFLDRTVAADLIGKKQLVPNTTDIICISPRKYVLSLLLFSFFFCQLLNVLLKYSLLVNHAYMRAMLLAANCRKRKS